MMVLNEEGKMEFPRDMMTQDCFRGMEEPLYGFVTNVTLIKDQFCIEDVECTINGTRIDTDVDIQSTPNTNIDLTQQHLSGEDSSTFPVEVIPNIRNEINQSGLTSDIESLQKSMGRSDNSIISNTTKENWPILTYLKQKICDFFVGKTVTEVNQDNKIDTSEDNFPEDKFHLPNTTQNGFYMRSGKSYTCDVLFYVVPIV